MLLQLEIRDFQLVTADALVARALAFCATKSEVLYREFGAAVLAPVPPWTKFNFELQASEFTIVREHFEPKPQCLGVNCRELANS
jgi:hypothetical protein